MKTRLLMSAMCAAAMSLCAAAAMNAQEGGPSIPQLAFHPVENFFHYPAYSVIGRFKYTPTRRFSFTYQQEQQFLTDARYPNKYRQDVSASLIGTAHPTEDLRLRGRVRYLIEDISDNTYLEESVWGYIDASYRVRARDRVRLRYDVYVYLDDRESTAERIPSPEHWLWLEYESRF